MSNQKLTLAKMTILGERLSRLPATARELLMEALEAIQQGEVANSVAERISSARRVSAEAVERALEVFVQEQARPLRRVVITGMGAVTALGHSVGESWQNLLAGNSGIDWITQFDASALPAKIAAEIKDWDSARFIDAKEARRMARSSQLALDAAHQALEDAHLPVDQPLGNRTGVVLGTALGGFEIYENVVEKSTERGKYRVRPMDLVGGLPNMPAFHISQRFGASGPLNTVVTACAAGTQAIGEAAELIRRGLADRVLTGGVESLIRDMFFTGFTSMKALSTRNDPPQEASRPFDATRDGFVIGEGGAVFVLEDLESALERGAPIYAEVLGHSASADAYHVAQPEPEVIGAQNAMRWALMDANLQPEAVDYINTHGSSTPLNDKTETHAIKQVFGDHAYDLAINSTKSMIGHAFGAAGAIEAMVITKSVQEDRLHPTINYETPDPECDLDCVPNQARQTPINIAMSNSFGLGGQNACLVVGKYANG